MTPDRLRIWNDRSVLIFLGGGFIIAPEPTWAAWFYVLVMPFGGWFVWRGWRPDWRDPRLMLLAGLIVWSTMTLLWADTPRPPVARQFLWVWNGLCTLTYLLTVTALAEQSARVRDRIAIVIVGCAALNAVWSIVTFLLRQGGWDRLEGWAETRNAILGASIMGVAAMLALGRVLRGGRWWPAWILAVMLFLGFIVLTDSRGPMLSVALAALFLLPRASWRRYLTVALAGLVAIGGLAVWQHDRIAALVDRTIDRGTSNRLEIWHAAIEQIMQRPLLGHGLTASLRVQGEFGHHPHDLYLSAWFYSGAIGLALLLVALGWLGRDVLRMPAGSLHQWAERRTCLALLAHLVLSGATDLSQITKGPAELWYIVWFPLAYVLGALGQTRARISENACATVAARIAARSPGNT